MRGQRKGRRLLFRGPALVLLFLFLPSAAVASTGYPQEMQAQIPLSYTPACSVCHAGNDTDAGAALTGFGMKMVSFGLMGGGNLPSLDGALEGLEGSNDPTIGYLKEGLDPSNPNAGSTPGITYGCFNVTGEGKSAGAGSVLVLGLALLLVLRRRGAQPPPPTA
jgi:MYXO-CTERM domain-containing protein